MIIYPCLAWAMALIKHHPDEYILDRCVFMDTLYGDLWMLEKSQRYIGQHFSWNIQTSVKQRDIANIVIWYDMIWYDLIWTKMSIFRLKFHWRLLSRVQLIPVALVAIMTWCRTGDEPLFDSMIAQLTDAYMHMRHSAWVWNLGSTTALTKLIIVK